MALLLLMTCLRFLLLLTGGRVFPNLYLQFAIIEDIIQNRREGYSLEAGKMKAVWIFGCIIAIAATSHAAFSIQAENTDLAMGQETTISLLVTLANRKHFI